MTLFEEMTGHTKSEAGAWLAACAAVAAMAGLLGYLQGIDDQAKFSAEALEQCITLKIASPRWPSGRDYLVCPREMKGEITGDSHD